jgi:hypothetical protein
MDWIKNNLRVEMSGLRPVRIPIRGAWSLTSLQYIIFYGFLKINEIRQY